MNNENPQKQDNSIVEGLQEMLSQLEEGGPDVVMDDIVAYVHQFLPPEIDDLVGKNIVRYRSWNEAYRQAVRERVAVDKIVADQNWIDIWNRKHNRHSLPLPTPEETACIAALAGESELMPIRNLFQSLGQRANISNIVQLQQIAQESVQHGFLSSEECEIEQSQESTEHALRTEQGQQPQTELAFQLAQPPEELLASICQQLLENKTLTEETKQSLLTLSEGLLPTQPLKDSFANWLREL